MTGAVAALVLSTAVAAQRGGGGGGGGNNAIASLKGVAVPEPPGLDQYVADRQALVVLGKALFWDTQVGSDGRTACATGHFHAGADHRVTNQVAGPANSPDVGRANTTLTSGDFPFHAFANPTNSASAATRSRRDVVGSAGIAQRVFVDIADQSAVESGADAGSPGAFSVGGLKVRQVTSRNSPSVINAVFNLRNFWAGRANSVFNAGSPFGPADGRADVLVAAGSQLLSQTVRLESSSLASQAVGPPMNGVEMSFDARGHTSARSSCR
jgi:cytochrome c peroxidase